MSPEQLASIRDTVTIVETDPDAFGAAFYGQLFRIDPSLRDLFPADLQAQRRKLVDEVAFLARAIDDFDGFVEHTRALGERHRGYGVRPVHFGVVQVAMIGALAETLGPQWSEQAEAAWRALYVLVAETMLEGVAPCLFERT